MKKTLIFLLDAVRPDYISKDQMPFLYSLRKKNLFLPMKTQIGYSSGAHATIWSSLHQDKHGKFLIYYYDPNNSPFKWASWMIIIPPFFRKFFIAALKVPYYKIKALNRSQLPEWYRKIINYPPALPPRIAKLVSTGGIIPKHKDTLFTVLDKEKISWFTQTDFPVSYLTKSKPKLLEQFKLTDNKVDFFYFYYADGLGHVKGIYSKEMKDYLKKVDNTVKRLIMKAKEKHDDINYIIFSDHGMCEIKHHINIQKYLKKLPIKQPKDYIAFFDATMARFWVFNDKARKILDKVLRKIPHATFIDNKLKKKYHIEFKDRKWGDFMLVIDPHYRPFPDYFAPLKFAIKSYHGYLPETPCTNGIFMSNFIKPKKKLKEINIVDILPTILKGIGLGKKIPKNIDGKPVN